MAFLVTRSAGQLSRKSFSGGLHGFYARTSLHWRHGEDRRMTLRRYKSRLERAEEVTRVLAKHGKAGNGRPCLPRLLKPLLPRSERRPSCTLMSGFHPRFIPSIGESLSFSSQEVIQNAKPCFGGSLVVDRLNLYGFSHP